MSYTVKPVTQYAVISNANGLPIALCRSRQEADDIAWMMRSPIKQTPPSFPTGASLDAAPYGFADWARR